MMNGNLLRSLILAVVAFIALASPARAATATYVVPANISNAELTALSTQGDNSGYTIPLNQMFAIVLDTPIGGATNTNVSIFTLAPSNGTAFATVRYGSYSGGSPQIVSSRTVVAGTTVDVSNLFQTGCSILGGCDYIEIVTAFTNKNAPGVEIDYIEVDGEIVQITSPTPEPESWALMIVGFAFAAFRLKAVRRARKKAPQYLTPDAGVLPVLS